MAKTKSTPNGLESKYRNIIEQANAGIIIIQDNVIKYANKKMVEITGYPLMELQNKAFLKLIHPDHFELLKAGYQNSMKGDKLNPSYDFKGINKPGEIKWFEGKPMKIDWNCQPAVLCFVSDITARKLAEDNLRISERRFKTILESTGYGYYETDEYGTFSYVNDQLAAIIGYPTHEIIGSNYATYTDEEHARTTYDVFDKIFKEKTPFGKIEHQVTRKDGSRRFVHMSITLLLDSYGDPLGFKGLVHDITAQKESEFKLAELHKKHIDIAHAAGMAEMASNTLHNVGNVLNSVKISGQAVAGLMNKDPYNMHSLGKANAMLKEHLNHLDEFVTSDPNGKKLLKYMAELIDEIVLINKEASIDINRLMNNIQLIENVVTSQQTYAGLGALTEYHSLTDLIEDSLVLKSVLLEKNNINVRKIFSKVPKIPVQKSKLIHIIINLINNAIASMLDTEIDQRILTFTIEQDEISLFLKVSDTGKGITGENLQKVFTHGYSTKKGGHGFGLHSSANYMSAMSGKIWADSDGIGKGATFVLQFRK